MPVVLVPAPALYALIGTLTKLNNDQPSRVESPAVTVVSLTNGLFVPLLASESKFCVVLPSPVVISNSARLLAQRQNAAKQVRSAVPPRQTDLLVCAVIEYVPELICSTASHP